MAGGWVRLYLGLELGWLNPSLARIFNSAKRQRHCPGFAAVPQGWLWSYLRTIPCRNSLTTRLVYDREAGERRQLTRDASGRECYVIASDDNVVGNTHTSREIIKTKKRREKRGAYQIGIIILFPSKPLREWLACEGFVWIAGDLGWRSRWVDRRARGRIQKKWREKVATWRHVGSRLLELRLSCRCLHGFESVEEDCRLTVSHLLRFIFFF